MGREGFPEVLFSCFAFSVSSCFLFAGFADGGHSCSSEKEGFRLF